ncbi:MAG: Rieske 2Fe-2S domain-containing protein [Balneolaceae bacterium]
MDRKKFIKLISAGVLCSVPLGGITGCVSYRYVDARRNGDQLEVPKSSFREDSFVLVRNPGRSSPIYLGKHSEDSYSAIFLECTHKQCTVEPSGETFTCPCHGSKYDREGKILEGPARQDLYTYQVTTDAGTIYIQLST